MEPTQTQAQAPQGPRLLSIKAAAALAGVHENTLRRMIAQDSGGALGRTVIDLPNARLRIRREAFERWLAYSDSQEAS